jgi:hypothetical protein
MLRAAAARIQSENGLLTASRGDFVLPFDIDSDVIFLAGSVADGRAATVPG